MAKREITKATNEVVAAAAGVVSWWEFDCFWGKNEKHYDPPARRLRKAIRLLAAAKKRSSRVAA